MRDAIESEKERHQNQVKGLTESLDTSEEKIEKLEQKNRELNEERSTLLARQKELQWEGDQESKRLCREI